MGRRLKIPREKARDEILAWYENKQRQVKAKVGEKARKEIATKLKSIEKAFGKKLDAHKRKYGYGQKGHPY